MNKQKLNKGKVSYKNVKSATFLTTLYPTGFVWTVY